MSRILRRTAIAAAVLVAVVLLGLAILGSRYTPNLDIPAGFAGKHIEVNGVPLRVLQQGAGRDVLLIHGSPGSIEDFSQVAPALGTSFRVTRFDRPGHGFSGDSGQYSPQYNAAIALALIHQLGLQHVIVAGHSYGGSTALAMALRDDPAVDAYVVLDSATYAPIHKRGPMVSAISVPVLGMGLAMLGQSTAAPQIRRELLAIFHTPPDEEFLSLRTRLWSVPKVIHALAVETRTAKANLAAMSPQYPRITRPVYIMAEADMEPRRNSAERLHGDIRGSTLVLVPDTGHYLQFEKAAQVIEIVRRAAAEHPPQEASVTAQPTSQP